MPLVILPDSMKAKFLAADGPVECCTADGTVVGYFTPTGAKKYDLDPGISEEEMERREAAGGGRPLADILRDLEKRA